MAEGGEAGYRLGIEGVQPCSRCGFPWEGGELCCILRWWGTVGTGMVRHRGSSALLTLRVSMGGRRALLHPAMVGHCGACMVRQPCSRCGFPWEGGELCCILRWWGTEGACMVRQPCLRCGFPTGGGCAASCDSCADVEGASWLRLAGNKEWCCSAVRLTIGLASQPLTWVVCLLALNQQWVSRP